MELHQLEYFRAMAHIKHFSKAAKSIAVSQPALSRSIAKLEMELGTQLLDRSDKQIELTPKGKKFLVFVEKALRELDLAEKSVSDENQADSGLVRLSFIQSLGGYFVPEIISRFRRLHPHISFSLSQDIPMALGEQLRDGKADLCLCSTMIPVERVGWRYLCSEELYLVVSKEHRLAEHKQINLSEVGEENFIVLNHDCSLRSMTDQFFDMAGIAPNIIFESADVFSAAGLVGADLGITILPKIPTLRSDKLVYIPIASPVCSRTVGLAWNTTAGLSEAATVFQNFVLEEFLPQTSAQAI